MVVVRCVMALVQRPTGPLTKRIAESRCEDGGGARPSEIVNGKYGPFGRLVV